MFDPTAYENIKVVLEGEVYDHDLKNEIHVLERNDWVNLADLSRKFQMILAARSDKQGLVQCTVELTADFQQLAAEWFPLKKESGANFMITFTISTPLNEILQKRLTKLLNQQFQHRFTCDFFVKISSEEQIQSYFQLKKLQPITEKSIEIVALLTEQVVEILQEIYRLVVQQ